jgi:hypothetical protein
LFIYNDYVIINIKIFKYVIKMDILAVIPEYKNLMEYEKSELFHQLCRVQNPNFELIMYIVSDVHIKKVKEYFIEACADNLFFSNKTRINIMTIIFPYCKGSMSYEDYNDAFVNSCNGTNLGFIKWIYGLYFDYSNNTYYSAFTNAVRIGNIEVLKWLYSVSKISIRYDNDFVFNAVCKFSRTIPMYIEIAVWLTELCDEYFIKMGKTKKILLEWSVTNNLSIVLESYNSSNFNQIICLFDK